MAADATTATVKESSGDTRLAILLAMAMFVLVVDTSLASNPDTDDVKSLNVVLPQGLVGDPRSAGRCSQSSFAGDACPADSKVGITTVTATVLGLPQDSAGDVYSLTPVGSEPARLGIIVRPSLGPMPLEKLFLQSPVTVGPNTNFGLSTTFDNLPRQVSGIDIRTDRLKLTLFGAAAHGPFVSNPTSCRPAIANTKQIPSAMALDLNAMFLW